MNDQTSRNFNIYIQKSTKNMSKNRFKKSVQFFLFQKICRRLPNLTRYFVCTDFCKNKKIEGMPKIQSILHLYCSIYREMPERKYTKAILKGFGPLLLPIQLLCTRDASEFNKSTDRQIQLEILLWKKDS